MLLLEQSSQGLSPVAWVSQRVEAKELKSIISKIQLKVKAVFKPDYYCPVCNQHIEDFQPLPDFFLDNLKKYGWPYEFVESETLNARKYLCPFCGASDRDRLYALYIQQYFNRVPSNHTIRIVDFAPSRPLSNHINDLIAQSKNNFTYRTADLSMEDVDDKVDITDMDIYESKYFDFFICSHMLEHVPDDRKALRELHRILQPGGQGILMVPIILSLAEIDEDPTVTEEGERWRRFGQDDHVRLYSKQGFLKRVSEIGFVIQQLGVKFFGKKTFTKCGITGQSVLYIVNKTDQKNLS